MSLFSSHSNSKNIVNCVWTAYRGDIIDCAAEVCNSPLFGPKDAPEIKFRIRFERNPAEDNSGAFLLRLAKSNTEDKMITVQCTFNVGNIVETGEEGESLEQTVVGDCRVSEFSEDHLKVLYIDNLRSLFGRSTCIIMHCEVKIRDLNPKHSSASYHSGQLARNLSTLRRDPIFSDITLHTTVDNTDFPAHRNILCARSKVFAAMLSNEGFVESKQERLEIPDMTADVMEILLDYLYSGDTVKVGPLASELLEAADRFDIQPLLQVCISFLHLNLCPNNAAKVYYIADQHHLDELKMQAIDYISHNAKEVRVTEGWNLYVRPNPDLIEGLFDYMAERKSKAAKLHLK